MGSPSGSSSRYATPVPAKLQGQILAFIEKYSRGGKKDVTREDLLRGLRQYFGSTTYEEITQAMRKMAAQGLLQLSWLSPFEFTTRLAPKGQEALYVLTHPIQPPTPAPQPPVIEVVAPPTPEAEPVPATTEPEPEVPESAPEPAPKNEVPADSGPVEPSEPDAPPVVQNQLPPEDSATPEQVAEALSVADPLVDFVATGPAPVEAPEPIPPEPAPVVEEAPPTWTPPATLPAEVTGEAPVAGEAPQADAAAPYEASQFPEIPERTTSAEWEKLDKEQAALRERAKALSIREHKVKTEELNLVEREKELLASEEAFETSHRRRNEELERELAEARKAAQAARGALAQVATREEHVRSLEADLARRSDEVTRRAADLEERERELAQHSAEMEAHEETLMAHVNALQEHHEAQRSLHEKQAELGSEFKEIHSGLNDQVSKRKSSKRSRPTKGGDRSRDADG